MSGQTALLGGVLGLAVFGGYIYLNTSNEDPSIYPYSKDQVATMLMGAKVTLPRRDGDGKIEIWSAGRSSKGVTLNMKYASWAPLLDCQAVITPVAENKSRVVADCGAPVDAGSAISRTQAQLRGPMFEEYLQATLAKRQFDRAAVDRKESAAVFQNLGGMQQEALQRARDDQKAMAGRKN